MITMSQLVVWLIVGALAGSLTGMLVRRSRRGFGLVQNLVIGLAGALLGGLIFNLFNIDLGLGDIAITVEDLIAAVLGSLLLLVILSLYRLRRRVRNRQQKPAE
ncbi:MAG: hypothetical protein Kow0077_30910 [Anaerolineae bacterium]